MTGGQYAAWYPEQGGNVYIGVQGNMRAATRGIASGPELSDKRGSGWMSGGYTGTWLAAGGEDLGQRTAWWINFGTYVPTAFYSSIRQPGVTIEASPALARWAAAMWMSRGRRCGDPEKARQHILLPFPYSDGLVLAVGSTGRITPDGARVTTGGETSA